MTPVEKMLLGNSSVQKGNTTKKHEEYALEYMLDYDIVRAYKAVYDEDGKMEDVTARTAGSRLLRSIVVQKIIDRETCKIIAEKRLEKSEIIDKLQRVYYEAMKDRDYTACMNALDKLMKHYGMYNEHQKQKRYSIEDVAAIRQKLQAQGVSFDAPNRPLSIENTAIEEIQDAQVIEKEEIT